MSSKGLTVTAALGLLLGQCLVLASQPVWAEENTYSPLNQAATYDQPGHPGQAPENQARFLKASLTLRQRLASLELEEQTLAVQPQPDQGRLTEVDREVTDLRKQIDQMATDMGGYVPGLKDCKKPARDRDKSEGRGMGRGGGMGRGAGGGSGGGW